MRIMASNRDTRLPASCLAQHGLEQRWMSPTRELECVTAIEQVATIKKDPRSGYNFFTYRAQSPWASLFSDGYVSRLRRKWSARGRAARIELRCRRPDLGGVKQELLLGDARATDLGNPHNGINVVVRYAPRRSASRSQLICS